MCVHCQYRRVSNLINRVIDDTIRTDDNYSDEIDSTAYADTLDSIARHAIEKIFEEIQLGLEDLHK